MIALSQVRLPPGWSIEWLAETDSTNEELKRAAWETKIASLSDNEILVLGAEFQANGRGRQDNSWHSEAGAGLTFSVLIRPAEPPALWPRLALVAGLAVAETLSRFGIEAEVKWPNDILVSGKKVCGILVESLNSRAIVGIGLNVNNQDFPEELAASSLARELGKVLDREVILNELLTALAGRLTQIGRGFPELLLSLRYRCALTNQRVSLESGGERFSGRVQGIGRQGELLLEVEGKLMRLIQAKNICILFD